MDQSQKGLYGSSFGGNILRVMIAEFLGTFFLVLAGTATATAAILHKSIAGYPADSLTVALAFGLVLIALIGAFGHISGAHFNPAVTLSLAITKKFPWEYVLGYFVAQFGGAIAASSIVLFSFGHAAKSVAFMAATFPALGVTIWQVLVIEAIVTFLLMLVIMSVATDERVSSSVVGPAIGFTLVAAILIAGPISGGAVNPARALGPMIIAGKYTGWWAYMVGPLVGAICAALIYNYFIAEAKQPKE